MRELRSLTEKFGKKEVFLKILKIPISRRRKWEYIINDKIDELGVNTNFTKEREELSLYKEKGIEFITFLDEEYPEILKKIPDPPLGLFVKGKFKKDFLGVSIVGTRRCSSYGKRIAEELGEFLSNHKITVISGLAYGIDSAAHRGALKGSGFTYAVLGSGINHIYPSLNRGLAERITESGALISEYPPDTPPLKFRFPERNRIISGLSKAVVVVEAPEKSGALITVSFALEQGREVFAVPGPFYSEKSRGVHMLIRDGAQILVDFSDLIKFLGVEEKESREVHLTEEEKILLNRIPDTPTYIDHFLDDPSLLPILISLEEKGVVKSFPGNVYMRVKWR